MKDRIDPISPQFFATEERKGGPTAVIYGFEDAYNVIYRENKKYGGYEKHPLYNVLYRIHTINVKTIVYDREHLGCHEFGLPPPDLIHDIHNKEKPNDIAPGTNIESRLLPPVSPQNPLIKPNNNQTNIDTSKLDKQGPPTLQISLLPKDSQIILSEDVIQIKKTIKCDETFADYLNDIARIVNKGFYKQMVKFVFLFRECLNHYGDRLNKTKQTQGVVPQPPEKKIEEGEEYCLINNAEQAPEVSNEFVTVYLEKVNSGLEKLDAIEFTQNLCNWLYINGYTCSKLSLIQSNT